jgi:hypothetical protein
VQGKQSTIAQQQASLRDLQDRLEAARGKLARLELAGQAELQKEVDLLKDRNRGLLEQVDRERV